MMTIDLEYLMNLLFHFKTAKSHKA